MRPRSALPFVIRRTNDKYSFSEYTSTKITAHGLLRIDAEQLVIQWRVSRKTEQMGTEYSTTEEHEPVREVVVPLQQLASAEVRSPWWSAGQSPHLILNAADLRAFEGVAGPEGMALEHPSQLKLQLQRKDLETARDFAADLEMAISDFQLRLAEGEPKRSLPRSSLGDNS